MNALPIDIPAGPRYGRAIQLAGNRGGGGRVPTRSQIQVAQLSESPRAGAQSQPQQYALAVPPPPPPRGGFRIVAQAMAAEVPVHRGGSPNGGWAIQVGAYSSETMAHSALASARERARTELAVAHTSISGVRQGRATLYRARMTGLSREAAVQACERLARGRNGCMVVSPESQL
jgi:cell division septation protein DedD